MTEPERRLAETDSTAASGEPKTRRLASWTFVGITLVAGALGVSGHAPFLVLVAAIAIAFFVGRVPAATPLLVGLAGIAIAPILLRGRASAAALDRLAMFIIVAVALAVVQFALEERRSEARKSSAPA